MDRRGFLCALCAVPAAVAGVRVPNWSSLAIGANGTVLTPFALVEQQMAHALLHYRRVLDHVAFAAVDHPLDTRLDVVLFADPLEGRCGWTRDDGVVEWMPPMDDHGPP